MDKEFFPPRPASHPMIYAYTDSNPLYKGLLKVGFTEKDVERRVGQQYPTKRPDGMVPTAYYFLGQCRLPCGGRGLKPKNNLF